MASVSVASSVIHVGGTTIRRPGDVDSFRQSKGSRASTTPGNELLQETIIREITIRQIREVLQSTIHNSQP